ncbi:MAG TPA: DUF488 family protein [Thermoanaerobaculia bacterium]|nr:DUF488 family protein [Thermoanaerobaculia bacterium]
MIRLKRVYEPPASDDGTRVLVERLWPRGVSKASGRIDLWTKEVAPSPELRRWYGHAPEKWAEFRRRYLAEIRRNPDVASLGERVRRDGNVTFVYAARDEERNSARVLAAFLGKNTSGKRRPAAAGTRTRRSGKR